MSSSRCSERARGGAAYALASVLLLAVLVGASPAAERPLDEPDSPRDVTAAFIPADSYQHALRVWTAPEDISAWIAANFSYDRARALRLSETARQAGASVPIHAPADFFEGKTGVCVDLARFAVEASQIIEPGSQAKYLMIEFTPVQVGGQVLRRHWLASFRRDGKVYFFADSKRPGHIAGPYDRTEDFIAEYERYRGRAIVAFRELESYRKQTRVRAVKTPAPF
jgi:hypothetical protein